MSDEKSFEELCGALGAVEKTGGEWVCKCPAHNDESPSLWLRKGDSARILLHCFGGCSQSEVIEALRGKGLWKEGMAQARRVTPDGVPYFWPPAGVLKKQGLVPSIDTQKQYVRHWVYRDLSGKIIGHVVRYEGHGKKDIIPFFKRWEQSNSWRSGHAAKSGRPMYGLDRLAKRGEKSVVFIVEGEKCADWISSAGGEVIGLSWPGGAKAYSRCDFGPVAGLDVVLWPDADTPGVRAMSGVAEVLEGLGCKVRFVDLSQFGEIELGWDCADWLHSGDHKNLDALQLNLIENAPKVVKQIQEEISRESNSGGMIPIRALTDVGNGERFLAANRDNVRFAIGIGWKVFNGVRWEDDHQTLTYQMAARVAEAIRLEAMGVSEEDEAKAILKWSTASQNVSRIEAMLKMAKSSPGVTVSADIFDPDPFLFACANGVLDLRTGELKEPSREQLITKFAEVEYDPEAVCPSWEVFISEVMAGNTELVEFLQRAIGYSMTGDTSEQVLFLLHGGGSNGKSVFVETLKLIFGTYAKATDAGMLLLDSRGDAATGSNSIARLQNTRLVVGSEIPPGARFNEARVKELTGQDTISARFLFQEFFDYIPDFKFWIRSNDRPEIRGDDLGIWRRILCVPFDVKFTDEQKDKNLPEKLRTELPGILNWALKGCREWQRIGLKPPQIVTNAVTNYKADMDVLGEWLGARCAIEPGAMVSSRALYVCYTQWCKSNGETPASHRKIGIALRRRGFERLNYPDGRYYKGIKILEQVSEESGYVSEGFQAREDDLGIF